MAENKKSFVLYAEYIETFEELSDEDAGKLVKHIFRYVNDLNPGKPEYPLNLAFIGIRQDLKRDLAKWEGIREKRSEAGKKGAEVKQKKAKQASAKSAKQILANQAVNVNANVNVLSNDNKEFDAAAFKIELAGNEHQLWRESWYMKFRVKPNSLSQILDKFNTHLGLKDISELPKNLKDYKEHFYNWCNVQERIGGLDEYKKGKKQGAL